MAPPPSNPPLLPQRPLRVLVLEHEPHDVEIVLWTLQRAGLKVRADVAATAEEFLARVSQTLYDIVLADYRLPNWTALDALDLLRRQNKDIPFVLITGTLGEEAAVDCIKRGVTDYILKGNLSRLPIAVARALEEKALRAERARAEQALRESEASFRLLFAHNPLPMWVFDLESLAFLQVNDAAVAHYGYSREEFMHRRVTDLRPPEDAGRMFEEFAQRPGIVRFAGQTRHVLKVGQIICVELILHRLEFGGRAAALVVAQDVTERQRGEEALRESEERYRILFETAPDAIALFDPDFRIVAVNQQAVALYGYQSKEELVGKNAFDLFAAGDRPRAAELATHLLETGGYRDVEFTGLKKDGSPFPIESSASLLRDEQGRTQAIIGLSRDLTERRQAEEALRRSELRYRGLVENATYGIYRATPAGQFLDANPALARMLGYSSAAELLHGDAALDIYCDPLARARILDQFRQGGRIDGVETEWKRRDSEVITVRLSGRAVADEQGILQAFEMIAEDVTERRSMEKHWRQVQKFEAIGQLAGGIAHDFNNVIGAILGWAELGQEQAPPESHLHAHFRHIREQAERAAGLTRQLLAFARRQILEPRNIDLNQTIGDLMSLLEKVIGKHIELSTALAPNLGVVRADPAQIEQVLMNLCLNARDAMPHGGRLVIQTRSVELDAEYCQLHEYVRPGRYVELSVTDTGMGMDAQTIEHVFEPFFTTKEPGKGTGLGLSTVYGVAKQHGGFVQIQSELGRGSVFQVYLPISIGAPIPDKVTHRSGPENIQGGSETILLAEDHEGVREMARMTLEGMGYRLLLAADGQEAVELFRAHQDSIALVLLDVIMPRLGGPDAYLQMRALRADLPVLFTTGYSAEASILGTLLENGAAVLQKPYSPSLLGRRVRDLLDQAIATSHLRPADDSA